ncbi:RHS repeat-associated core domain-containing protein [Micromonospora sp. WMMD1102]|uniref:RHS repeat-associated core domain-containing protein n=1 Tax=Micromonospora sp. WMMD1102 TaxID=3016105 RepID=UPI002414EABC|nr:RHS repeat-associated core domain-containing protein [Micromonospora sp. WMMD1102]MDG4784879.1 RHS repeat-associated core domain-containing protein [Micromonospora sp. WMMD1102]
MPGRLLGTSIAALVLAAGLPAGTAAAKRPDLPVERAERPAPAAAPAPAGPREHFYDAAGQLVGVADPATGAATYSYDEAGNLLETRRLAADALAVFALVPERGPVGTTVEISGVGFSATAATNTVTVDGIAAPVTAATANRLTVAVPAGVGDGVVEVAVNGRSAQSPRPFRVQAGTPVPTITAVSTDRGNRNELVTVTGTGFDPDRARNVVMFHRTVAQVQAATPTSLTVRIPAAASSGRISVRTPGGTAQSPTDFLVAPRGFVMSNLAYAGTVAAGRPAVTATVPAGKAALLLLDGTAGERVNVTVDNNTVPVRSALWLFTPYGGNFGRGSLGDPIDVWAGGRLTQDLPALPTTGTYAMVIKPNDDAAGTLRVTVSNTLAGLTLTKDGAGVPFQITVPQQTTVFPFTATAGEWLSLGLTELSEPGNRFVVTITDPNNRSQTWDYPLSQYIPTMIYKATLTGTHRLAVTFGPNELGFGKVWLSTVLNGPTLGINGADARIRIDRPGQSVRLPFAGTTGQVLQLGYSENTLQQHDRPAYPGALLIEPDEVQRELLSGGYPEARNLPTLRKNGQHSLLITGWQAVGTVRTWLSTAIEGGPLAVNTRKTVTIDRPGRDAWLDVDGVQGRPLALGTINNSVPGEVTLRLYRPNGNLVSLGTGRSIDVTSLPDTGRYRLQVDPEASGTGAVHVYAAEPVDLGLITLDTAIPAPINLPGQKVVGRINAQVGQRLSLGSSTALAGLSVRVTTPTGGFFWSGTVDPLWGQDLPAFTVAGEHRIEVSALNRETGDLTLYLSTESDAGLATVGGPALTVTIPRPAQNGRLTFVGNANDRLDIQVTRWALTGNNRFYFALYGPDGRALATRWWMSRDRELLPTLTATGTHTLVMDPPQGATGEFDITVKPRTAPTGRKWAEPAEPVRPGCDTEPARVTAPTAPAPGQQAGEPEPEPAPNTVPGCVDAGWAPDERNLGGADWTTRREPVPTRERALQFPVGLTGVVGRVLDTADQPLAKVTVSGGGKSTTTDADGLFALAGVPGGHLSLRVDGRSASTAQRRYGVFDIGVELTRGEVLVLPYTMFLPKLDTASTVSVASPTTREVVLTTRAIPGLEVHVPAGTVIRDADGNVATELNLTPIPIDRPPFPLPPTKVPVYFTVQPGGGVLFPEGARIIYPNYTKEAPGTRTQFWNYDPDGKGWHVYGLGRVSADGRQIVPDPEVRFYRLTGAMTAVPGMNPPALAPRANGTRVADPVDPATGLLVDEQVDLVVDDVMPIEIKRTYQQGDQDVRAFGVGMNFDYGMFPWSPGQIGNFDFQQFDFVQPDGSKIHYRRTSPGNDYAGAVFAADPTPTRYAGSTVAWNGDGWDVKLRDGTVYVLGDEAPVQEIRDKYGNTTTITRATAAPGTDGKVRQNGAITQITSPSGRWVKFSYDAASPPKVVGIEDNLGRKVGYTYDSTNRLRFVTNAEQGVTAYTWDSGGRLDTITDPREITYLDNEYDSAGRVFTQQAADGGITRFDYTAVNNVITETKMTDPRGHVRRFTFNAQGSVLTDTRAYGTPLAQTTAHEYEADGVRRKATVDALNRRTTFGYNARGQVDRVVTLADTAAARTETFEFHGPYAELTKSTDSYDKSTIYEIDPRGALKSVTDPMNRKTTYTVNGSGQVTKITDPATKSVTIDYVGSDPVRFTDQLGRVSRAGFDALGRQVRTVDGRGAAVETSYDNVDQLRSVTDALGRTTRFEFDPNGNQTEIVDPRQGSTVFDYDNMDRVETITDPKGAAESFTYDLNGNLDKHTSRRDILTDHDHDELDRLKTRVIGAEATVGYTYDAGNRLRRTEDSVAGVTVTDYDDLDRVSGETTPHGTVSYQYSPTVRDRTMTIAGRTPTRHLYDANGALAEIQQGGTVVTAVSRDVVGRPERVGAPGSGVSQTYAYTDAGQVRLITYRAGTTVLGDLGYEYDSAGQPVRTTGAYSRTQLPAPFGPASYDAANRIETLAGTAIRHDADGNLSFDGTTSYTWNARGELSGLSRTGLSASFGYSTDGRRLDRTVDGATVNYLYDGLNPVQEKVDGAVTATTTSAGVDGWQLRESGGTTKRYLTDGLGSTLGLVDNAGAGATYAYEPFGATAVTGDDGGNPYRYTGREDDGTGLYYYRNRYYSPTLQRFISEDPIGIASGDANPYAYVFNHPTALTDPMGTKPARAGGRSCRPNSFTPETPVRMADGSQRRIADVEVGDMVLATDPETGRTGNREVTATIVGEGRKQLVDVAIDNDGDGVPDGRVTATDEHPFWVAGPRQWRDAKELKAGDLLRTAAGTYVQVVSAAQRSAVQRVHNLTVDDLHTYYVLAGSEPVLVHNIDEEDICRQTLGAGPYAREGVATTKRKVTRSDPEWADNQINGIAYGCHTCGRATPATRNGQWIFDHQPPVAAVDPAKPYRGTGYPQCGRSGCQPQQGGIMRQLTQGHYNFPPV